MVSEGGSARSRCHIELGGLGKVANCFVLDQNLRFGDTFDAC